MISGPLQAERSLLFWTHEEFSIIIRKKSIVSENVLSGNIFFRKAYSTGGAGLKFSTGRLPISKRATKVNIEPKPTAPDVGFTDLPSEPADGSPQH